jgi:thiosulfate/3-mercaptopyruvate sulfurtransferase
VLFRSNENLCGPIIPGQTGRHPLPDMADFAATLSAWGIDHHTQVIAYDSFNSAYSARLWWMLRWAGHEAVAILDGGWPLWTQRGLPVSIDIPTPAPARFIPRPRPELAVEVTTVDQLRLDPAYRLFDSRAAERYRGEVEPIDPVAGHIPGAALLPWEGNTDAAGQFLPPETLRARFLAKMAGLQAEQTVYYCGFGITAAQNVFAVALAGLGEARLYTGSWSEWLTDPARPIATGDEA